MSATLSLPRYKCHKQVRALKLAEGIVVHSNGSATLHFADSKFEPLTVPKEVISRHIPMPGDYLVMYDDDYTSISPAKAFEQGYTLIPEGDA